MSTTVFDTAAQGNVKTAPMSFNQEGLWFLDQLDPESATNTLTATVRISKVLVPDMLETSLNKLVERHEILRTTFHVQEGQLLQIIAPHLHIQLPVTDLQKLPLDQQQMRVQSLATIQARQPFELGQGPLLRCMLLQLAPEHFQLLLTLHHIIADDWSVSLFVRELACLYEAHHNEQPLPLPPLSCQYADFARWQRPGSQAVTDEHIAYWQQQLADVSGELPLPFDRLRSAQTSVRGAIYRATLPYQLSQSLRQLSQQQDVSQDALLAAAWLTLLSRYTAQQDLLIGTIAPARRNAQTETLLGPCEQVLLLRGNLVELSSFTDLLKSVHTGLQTSREHADQPIEPLLQALPNTRSRGQRPRLAVLLRLPCPQLTLPADWQLVQVDTGTPAISYDLALSLYESPHGLIAHFTYSPDLFDETTIARLAGHWQTLLAGIAAAPNQPLSRLPLLTERERTQLLVEWNATSTDLPAELCMHQLFEAQVEHTPDAVAVVCQDEQISYQELNQQANQLAHHLRDCGVGPETLVALLAERSIPFVVALLAIFKAGGAYLPLDPHHPQARLLQVIEQSRCQFVLRSTAFADILTHALATFPRDSSPLCINLDGPHCDLDTENLATVSTPGNLAYVIYTSGSTGLPKGAMVEQRGMLNHLYAKIEALELSATDTVAQTASQSFDISVWQFLAALLVGGRVQIYPDVVAHDALQLLQYVELQQVSILETVPSLLRAMLGAQEDKAGQRPQLKALRWLIPTGEALPVELCRRWLQRYPRVPMLNAYGPTECSDDVTHYVISQPPDPQQRSIPIGRAIRNMQLYVLDQHLQPLPIGVSGELYVGGIGVGRGYLSDQQRTAEAFVTDPFAAEDSRRLYKTGDLACYLPDGNLEFIGRKDTQVKLRGYRIELGEIEAVLNQQEEIREAVVVVREIAGDDKRLVAYVVLQPGQTIKDEELKRLIKKRMPAYMVPTAFVQLEKLPLTSNGKLDRAALPAPEWSRETEENYVAPVLPLHRQLVSIWEEVLGIRPIGIKDDFFELGGDSLLAVRLFERIEQECGKKLGLATLFAGATIEQVAVRLGVAEAQAQTRTPLVTVQAGGARTPFFFLHGEWKGGALYTLELAHHLGAEQPFYLLAPYKFDGLVVPPTFEDMAAAHLATLRQVQPEGPYLLGGYCNGALMAYEMARQLHAQGQDIDLLLLIDPDAPARHRWVRRAISRTCNLVHISQERQFAWFLCLQHIYRYLRFSHYRQVQNSALLAASWQGSPAQGPGNTGSAPTGLKLKALVPKVDALRQNDLNVYDWPATDYSPDLYVGKMTFFWTSEEPWRPVGWQKVVKARGSEVEIHMLPGNHITSRTKHLPVMAECLRVCLSKAQATARNKE